MVTVTFAEPDAPDMIAKVALIWVAETTLTLLTVMPEFDACTVAPEAKPVPVSVTFKVLPGFPLAGLIDVSVGTGRGGLESVKVTGTLSGLFVALLDVMVTEPL